MPQADELDEVTNGNVPWSTSRSVAWAPLEKNPLAVANHSVQQRRGVDRKRSELFRILRIGVANGLGIDRLRVVQRHQRAVFQCHLVANTVGQGARIHQIADTKSAPSHLVFVGGSDAA